MGIVEVSKEQIALLQIEKSIILLTEYNDSISALTLAGAAEEILGKMAIHNGHTSMLENWNEFLGSLYDYVGKQRPDKKTLTDRHNKIRNEVKHNDTGTNNSVTADFDFEAEDMLLRAIKNYYVVFDKMPESKLIINWFDNITL